MNLEQILYDKFGYRSFRAGQRLIIEDLLRGRHVIAMLPTGGGKSICYQLPAYCMKGTALIVSPLLSLMEDQVNQLRLIGEKRVIAFNSFRSAEEKREAMQRLDTYKFIFVSPEMLQVPFFVRALQQLVISLFVVDEAHCISQWGYDFRMDYKKLDAVLDKLGHPLVLALTATATEEVIHDIAESLHLQHPAFHLHSIDRPNIALTVEKVSAIEEKKERLLSYVKKLQGPGIIYCSSRFWTEALAEYLRPYVDIAYYHGGMEQEDRMLIQQQFMNGQLSVVVCTSAFGMGINKPNVRYVIHFHYPPNLESYMQEIGRAGRDGQESIAILLLSEADHDLPLSIIQDELPGKAHILHFLSIVRGQPRPVLPLEEIEYMAQQAGFSEQHWRFLRHQFEQLGVIQEHSFYVKHVPPAASELLYDKTVERLNKKYEKLYEMRTWLQSEGCRRSALLRAFLHKKEGEPSSCCDCCGLDVERYAKKDEVYKVSLYGWKTELLHLLGVKNHKS